MARFSLRAILLPCLLASCPAEEVVINSDGSLQDLDPSRAITFVNLSPYPASLYWDDGRYGQRISDSVPAAGGSININSFLGHTFFWTWEGSREWLGTTHTVTDGQTTYELPADTERREGLGDQTEDSCSDRYPTQCPRDARRGECQKNPGWMAVNCARSCDYCHFLDPATRCDRARLNMSETAHLQPGDLDALFARTLTDFPELRPRALSSPTEGKPWVVIFENFVQDDEIEALIEQAGGLGFRRSTDTGPANQRGEVKKIVSTSRTSENAWCTGACAQHPLVHRVTQRIERVTGVPESNYEQFQVLRYERGQYYRPHHDAGPSSFKLACGPRILTFFLYLSDVEKGGGTRFPKILGGADGSDPLVVHPRRGQAILWPSVLSDDPGSIDMRTTHEAMPVEEGVKFAANHWIHDYDFKIPNLWGCTGAFD